MIEIDTPQSIYNETDPPVDVFYEALAYAGFTGDILSKADNCLWDRFRYRMINNCNRSLWMDYLGDKARSLHRKYELLFEMFEDTDFTDTAVSSYENEGTTETEEFPDIPIDPTKKYLSGKTSAKASGKSYSGTAVETYRSIMDMFGDPYTAFATEFDGLFLNRW